MTSVPVPAIRIDVVSLFPEMCAGVADHSIVSRARKRGLLDFAAVDPRRWAGGRHRVVDDRPCGGGPGMVLKAPPIADAVEFLRTRSSRSRLLMTSPQGRRLDQSWVDELAGEEHLIIVCGHYEGIDERFVERYDPEEFSIGDLVLSGGELPAMVLVDAVVRQLPGALGHEDSAVADSFSAAHPGLDHPCYTKPVDWDGAEVPPVLLSGDHAAIAAWRKEQSRRRTVERRPDLLDR